MTFVCTLVPPCGMQVYKSLNTFIDDLFAFIIKMPTMHRLSCFRDDVIFLIYLYQRWIYPVDKKRINEFGQLTEDNKVRHHAELTTVIGTCPSAARLTDETPLPLVSLHTRTRPRRRSCSRDSRRRRSRRLRQRSKAGSGRLGPRLLPPSQPQGRQRRERRRLTGRRVCAQRLSRRSQEHQGK